ncbi:MAG: hypothetical protein A2Y12_02695 [Planctomycetes bacterium GWF2_42_9]|nr:MAG: hypothetical protein A2Y12_02695 [Planctomycetes bacterium GWF2_42_9]HAL44556.1 hypothetical protein [Phycisphaerales bacterium]
MGKCPYCRKDVALESKERENHQVIRYIKGFIKKEVMYVCPHCESILGFSFFLGGLLTGRPK